VAVEGGRCTVMLFTVQAVVQVDTDETEEYARISRTAHI